MSIKPVRPTLGEDNYLVQVEGTGNLGAICARVQVFDPGLSALDGNQGSAVAVYARVYKPGTPVDSDPLMAANPAASLGKTEANNVWYFAKLTNAAYGPPRGTRNLLVIWAIFQGSGNIERARIPFFGIPSDHTECALIGSGSGASPDIAGDYGGIASSGVTLELAPLLWAISTAGFALAYEVFNGNWSLELRTVDEGYCVWHNGADGVAQPYIQLSCESPIAETWRLQFQFAGLAITEYIQTATEWKPLSDNSLACEERPGLPGSITVTPG